jgi:P-type Ca2+ transporter type 2C
MGTGRFFKNEEIGSKYVWYSLILSVLVLLSLIQIPYARQALNVVSMTINEWIIILTASALSVIVIQVGKYLKVFK